MIPFIEAPPYAAAASSSTDRTQPRLRPRGKAARRRPREGFPLPGRWRARRWRWPTSRERGRSRGLDAAGVDAPGEAEGRLDLEDGGRLPPSVAPRAEVVHAVVLPPQPARSRVVGSPVAPALEPLDLDLFRARVGPYHHALAEEEEEAAEDDPDESHRRRDPPRTDPEGVQRRQLPAPGEQGGEERGSDDQGRRRQLVGDHRGLVPVQLEDRLSPRAPGELVRAIREIHRQVEEHHAAERGHEDADQLADDVAIEEPERARTHSVPAMSRRICAPGRSIRPAAP